MLYPHHNFSVGILEEKSELHPEEIATKGIVDNNKDDIPIENYFSGCWE